jgi:Fe2+ transport system protein FeoA
MTTPAVLTLDDAPTTVAFAVHEVANPTGGQWPHRLEELGFLPGEQVMVLMRGTPGREPLAVRIGHSTFALRRSEAALIRVRRWPAEAVR